MHSHSSLNLIRPIYRQLLDKLTAAAQERFGAELAAVWIWACWIGPWPGSIAAQG